MSQFKERSRLHFLTITVGLLGAMNFFFPGQSQAKKENYMGSSTNIAPGIFIQSFELTQRWVGEDEIDSNFFLKKRFKDEGLLEAQFKPLLPLYWNFGLAYTRLGSAAVSPDPTVVDDVFTAAGGIDWDVSPDVTFGTLLNVDSIPKESYRHGAVLFKLEYQFSFAEPVPEKRKVVVYDEDEDVDLVTDKNDASHYYREQRDKKLKELYKVAHPVLEHVDEIDEEQEKLAAAETENQYPHMKLIFNLGIHLHSTELKAFRRPSKNGAITGNQEIRQIQSGPEVIYLPDSQTRYHFGFNYFAYTSDVDTFLFAIDIAPGNRQAIGGVGGWSPYANQVLTFPQFTVDEGVDYDLNDKDTLYINFNQTSYAYSKQSITFALSPAYFHDLSKSLRMGVGADFIFGGVNSFTAAGSFELHYRL